MVRLTASRYWQVVWICGLVGTSSSYYKRWVPNTNYDNPENWNAGRVPCKNDRVHFPESLPPVYIQRNSSVLEIVLPSNGELVLGQYMSLSFPSGDDGDQGCQGQDIEFTRMDPESWFDPDNWCEVADPDGACMSEQPSRLDSERPPCDTDEVIFPRGSGVFVDLDSGVDLYMPRLTVDGTSYTTRSFRDYVDGAEGRKRFHRQPGSRPTTVNVVGHPCSDVTGCICGNDQGEIHKRICAVQSSRCGKPTCESPLVVEGHCCKVCGAVLEVEYGLGFRFKSLENMVYNSIPRNERDSVKVIVSKTGSEVIQVALQNTGDQDKAGLIGVGLEKKLHQDISGGRKYGVTEVRLRRSDGTSPFPSGAPQSGSQSGKPEGSGSRWLGSGSIASLVIAILALILLVALGMYCLIDRRRPPTERQHAKWPSFRLPFRKMGSAGGEMELGSTPFRDDKTVMYGDMLRAFNNPVYDTPQQYDDDAIGAANGSNPVILDASDIEPTFQKSMRSDSTAGFSNPLYGQSQQSQPTLYIDANMKINPVFTQEGIEEDSSI